MKNYAVAVILFATLTNPARTQETTTTLELPDYPRVLVETTAGDFTIELFAARAPLTVTNFVQNVVDGFYQGTVFHRIVGGFVVQGGGYDSEYKLKETRATIPNESGNGLSNRRGFVAMARTGDPHSANSQFYINLADNVPLDPRPTRWGYTVFGKVIAGMDVIDEIGYVATGPGPVPELTKDVPTDPIVITRMTLLLEETDAAGAESAADTDADSSADADSAVEADPDSAADADSAADTDADSAAKADSAADADADSAADADDTTADE